MKKGLKGGRGGGFESVDWWPGWTWKSELLTIGVATKLGTCECRRTPGVAFRCVALLTMPLAVWLGNESWMRGWGWGPGTGYWTPGWGVHPGHPGVNGWGCGPGL